MDTTAAPMRSRFRRRLASGVVALVPIFVTVAVVRFFFDFTASILLPIIDPATEAWPPIARAALSFGVLVLAVYLLGELATNFIGRRILAFGESVVLRLPLVKVVYSATKQVAAAFEKREARAFQSVVFVEFPREGMRSVAFVTGRHTDRAGLHWVTVFVPTTPNPTTGFLQIVPEDALVETGYTVEEGIKMIMSLGVVLPTSGIPTHA